MSQALTRRLSGWNVALPVYAIAAFIGLAGLLLQPGTVGHHWDWLIPSDPMELRHFAQTSASAWQDFAFGSYVTYRYGTTLTSFLLGAPGFIGLGGSFVTKALLVFSVFTCGAGMRFLLLTLVRTEPDERDGLYATLCGLLYALAPFAYNQMIAGDQSALISNALSPIAIALAIRAMSAQGRMWWAFAIGSALLLMLVVASAQVFLFTAAIMWIVCLVLCRSWRSVLRLAAVTAGTIALCSFWILPAFLGGGAVHTVLQTASPDRAFATYEQFTNPILTLTTIGFPGDFYLRALGSSGRASVGAVAFFAAYAVLGVLWIAALIARRSTLLIVLSAIFVLAACLPLGGNPIIGPLILTVFKALLPYSLILRTPQHIMFVVTLIFPILAFLSVRVIPAKYFVGSLAGGALVVLAYSQGFLFHSDFFGLLGPFPETLGEAEVAQIDSRTWDPQYRTLFVPNDGSFYFHRAIFDYYFESGDESQVRFLPSMTMAAGSKWTPYDGAQAELKALDELIPDGADPSMQHLLLQMAGIKHIVVHQIGVPGAGVRLAGNNSRQYLEAALQRSGVASLEQSLGDRTLWSFADPVTRAYAPDCVFGVPPQAGPYDILALGHAAAPCARPAAIPADSTQRSLEVYPSSMFRTNPAPGIPLGDLKSNVQFVSASRQGFVTTVPSGVNDVETVKLSQMPAKATGISMRMYSSGPRRVWVQLFAPDDSNYYQAMVDFSGKVQDVVLNFSIFGRVGYPERNAIRVARFVSRNDQPRDEQMYLGSVRWVTHPSHSRNASYLALATNRWDQYYFGSDRPHVLFEALPGMAPVYTAISVARTGNYAIFAHVQEYQRPLSLQVSVEGKWSPCSPSRSVADVSERLISLTQTRLTAGTHTIGMRYCSIPPRPRTQDVGVQSLIVAAAGLAPPAQWSTGSVDTDVIDQRGGAIVLQTSSHLVVLTDAFDDRWTAEQNGTPLAHIMVNGYANGWLVPDPGAGGVVVTFAPQRFFTLGMNITFILIFLGLGAIVLILITRRQTAVATP
ncbi:MAG TPA: hypothetical protein VGF98_08210 [Candidatus Tumulicola sp.]|jgi:hypothetical protein